ncbi:hypothetical protein [Haloprofundus salinisoli]|uniref:hypothetical protein n=1 Tax=Haloprofundus salinisoli TaxID=2876193 RepID=UPI001CC99803|nr:hypothetical protein [Haloprofundus salinisoli]
MSPPLTRRGTVRAAASVFALGLGGCAGQTNATENESYGEPKIETSTATPEPATNTNVGRIVLRNGDSTAHELDVAINHYGEEIHRRTHTIEADGRETIPLREPGSYSITVGLDGDTVSYRESLTESNRCREWELSVRVTAEGTLKRVVTVCPE